MSCYTRISSRRSSTATRACLTSFSFNATATTDCYTYFHPLPLQDALPISRRWSAAVRWKETASLPVPISASLTTFLSHTSMSTSTRHETSTDVGVVLVAAVARSEALVSGIFSTVSSHRPVLPATSTPGVPSPPSPPTPTTSRSCLFPLPAFPL